MNTFREYLKDEKIDFKKNRIKKVWYKISDDEKTKFLSGDKSTIEHAIAEIVLQSEWSEDEKYQKKWREVTNRDDEDIDDLISFMNSMEESS